MLKGLTCSRDFSFWLGPLTSGDVFLGDASISSQFVASQVAYTLSVLIPSGHWASQQVNTITITLVTDLKPLPSGKTGKNIFYFLCFIPGHEVKCWLSDCWISLLAAAITRFHHFVQMWTRP